MKRFSLVTAFAVSLLSVSAESVTIEHNTAGGLEAELNAAIAANDNLTSMADITDLTIIGEAVMNATDFAAIRTNLKANLETQDLSQAVCPSLPDTGSDKAGSLNAMTVLKKVLLPDNLTTLGRGSFYNCTELEYVNLPDGITTISQYCFSGCKKFNTEKLPANLRSVQPDAFRYCESLTLSELPESVWQIRGYAFAQSGVKFDKLPDALTDFNEEYSFQKTNVTFSEFPAGITTLAKGTFSGTKVTFSTIPDYIKSVASFVFQSVTTLPEFTIPQSLWKKIPDATFWNQVQPGDRFFICRASSAPTASTEGDWNGVFGRGKSFSNITFKVLASAEASYKETAPYNTMNLVRLTTTVPQPILELPEGIDASQIKVSLFVFDTDHTDFSKEVLEGEGEYKVTFTDEADSKLYVEEIRFESAAAYAEGEEDTEAPVDPELLYAADGDVSSLLKKGVNVPVVVAPGMNAVRVKVALANNVSGVENVEAATTGITRQGDIFFAAVAGIRVYDLAGRVVLSSVSNTIDISTLPAGAYVLQAGKSVVKIIK